MPLALLLSSIRSLGFFLWSLCRHSPPSRSLERTYRLAKHWKTNQAHVVHSCFMAAFLPWRWNICYDLFQWHWFRRSIDVIFYCFHEKSPASVTKVPAAILKPDEPCQTTTSCNIHRRCVKNLTIFKFEPTTHNITPCCNMSAQCSMLWYVVLKCCDYLAGA